MTDQRDDHPWTTLTRRSFLRAGVGVGAAGVLASCDLFKRRQAGTDAGAPNPTAAPTNDEPFADLADTPAPRSFFGDDFARYHEVLWDKAKTLAAYGGLPSDPSAFERTRVCVVGGGLAGLSAAYLLRDKKPLVLEGAARLGGNAKAHRSGGVSYALGSAYITNTDFGDEHMRMLAALGLDKQWRFDDPTHDRMLIGGAVLPEFWFGGTDRARAKDFRAAWDYFAQVREHAFPEIPFEANGQLTPEAWTALDQRTFQAELERALGKSLHPHVEDVARQYCWSSFGADSAEISAAAGLNFLASDLGGMYVFPGGNASISQALVTHLRGALGHDAVRSSQIVVDIRRAADGVRVTTLGLDNRLRTILADTCVVSTPKFIAKRLVDGLTTPQVEAMSALAYRAYVVAHVLVDQPREPDFHDLFCIAGRAPAGTLRDELAKRPFTDVVLATFATHGHPTRTALNLYRGFPFDTGRAELFAEGSYERHRSLIESALPATLRALGLDPSKVRDVRLSRWGHPMVVPRPGLISSGVPARAAAPHAERIFFAQQDNHAMSAFESSFAAAAKARTDVLAVLGG